MTYLREEDVARWNKEQWEMRKDLPNLFQSMLQSKEGNSDNLDLQVFRKRKIEYWKLKGKEEKKIHEYIVLMDKQLNDYLIKLKQKYCNNDEYIFSAKYKDTKIGVKSSNKVFDSLEIESMLVNYLLTFPFGYVEVCQGIFINVPDIEKFKGENDEHSNNKLVNYIIKSFEKQVLLKRLHNEKDVKRVMVKGKTYFVKQNDIETVSFEDIELPQKASDSEDDDIVTFDEIINENYFTYDYSRQKEFNYILNNYREVLTENQLQRFDQLLNAIETGQINIDDLFHPIHKNKLNIEAVGKILFPDKDNSYRQPAVKNMLKSMKNRMDKELKKQGFIDKEIRSDYAPLPMLPASENKKYKDYKIDSKYLMKNYYINNLHMKDNGESLVKFYVDEQVIPLYELVNLMTKKITVSELIKKYNINKKMANSMNGAVYTYIPDAQGEHIINGKPYRLVEKKFALKDGTEYKYIDEKNLENILHTI
jgi:hypothetical protein